MILPSAAADLRSRSPAAHGFGKGRGQHWSLSFSKEAVSLFQPRSRSSVPHSLAPHKSKAPTAAPLLFRQGLIQILSSALFEALCMNRESTENHTHMHGSFTCPCVHVIRPVDIALARHVGTQLSCVGSCPALVQKCKRLQQCWGCQSIGEVRYLYQVVLAL